MRLRCTNCNAAFDRPARDRDARCPKCLRRTTVTANDELVLEVRDGAPAPWPAGTACPLCLEEPVSEATFHFELGELSSPSASRREVVPVVVRCCCCLLCRRRLVMLARLRLGALPFVAAGMLAWPLSLASDLPYRLWGIGRLEMAMLSTLLCAVVIGLPLVMVDRRSRVMRRRLETSWLFQRVMERRATAPSSEAAGGREPGTLMADAPARVAVVDATELLRS